jgi:Domain of unknown function (DUF222)/HNH endonuclease
VSTTEPSIESDLVRRADALHRSICVSHNELFFVLAEIDRRELWRDSGARDIAHWLWMRYGLSDWKAHRWVAAAHALDGLPLVAEALRSGDLGVDHVVELTRFARAENEHDLVTWARQMSSGAVRHRADVEVRRAQRDAADVHGSRRLDWRFTDEGRRFELEAELPASEGAVVAKALTRIATELPVLPGEEDPYFAAARRADALVALASTRVATDADPDRATVVVHASVEALAGRAGGCEVEGGGVLSPETARRLLCHGRVQAVLEEPAGQPLRMGRIAREPTAAMLRQVRYRDRECRFPGCGSRRFTQAHHIVWWERGGATDLENLILLCTFHHRLVHELGWSLTRRSDGEVRWYRPDGRRYRSGPAPPLGADAAA